MAVRATATAICFATVCASSSGGSRGRKLSFLLGENLEKKSMISTQSALQIIIHLAKIIIFSLLGFSLTPWILLAGGAVICAYLGAIAGTKILHLIPEKTFRIIMTWVVLLLAARLVVIGVEGFYDF